MNNKTKNWTDVQLIISSISVAITFGFWGLFSSQEKSVSGIVSETPMPTQPDMTLSTPAPILLPGQKLLFSGINLQNITQTPAQLQNQPKQPQVIVTRKKHGGGGGSGGGGGGSPHAGTGSSKP